MNKQHKWHKEIKAWADGAEIEYKLADESYKDHWISTSDPSWNIEEYLFRIKPLPKEPQYLKVYGWLENENICFNKSSGYPYIGKIKLEQDDEYTTD